MKRTYSLFLLLIKNTIPFFQTIPVAVSPIELRGAGSRKSNRIHGYISCNIL